MLCRCSKFAGVLPVGKGVNNHFPHQAKSLSKNRFRDFWRHLPQLFVRTFGRIEAAFREFVSICMRVADCLSQKTNVEAATFSIPNLFDDWCYKGFNQLS